jgi:hypothetical protein
MYHSNRQFTRQTTAAENSNIPCFFCFMILSSPITHGGGNTFAVDEKKRQLLIMHIKQEDR